MREQPLLPLAQQLCCARRASTRCAPTMRVMHLDSPTTRYRLYWGLGLTVLFNGMLLAWLLLKPGHHALVAAVDNGAQCVGPLLVLLLCMRGTLSARGLRGNGAG